MPQDKRLQITINAIHIIAWTYIFTSPILFAREPMHSDYYRHIPHIITTFFSCLFFYAIYFFLVPKLIYKEKKHYKLLFLIVILTAIIMTTMFEVLYNYLIPYINKRFPDFFGLPDNPFPPNSFTIGHIKIFLEGMVRNFTTFITTAGVAIILQLSLRWQRSENERQKAETARAEAELQVLRHQLSPHFLLNSLNNIYSLVAFDQSKAQNAIVELSKMLRYQLYESNAEFVPLKKEVEFLKNYISLMRIRISDTIVVNTSFDYDDENLLVAPNILIYLVENAFKYGSQPTGKAAITMKLVVKERQLTFLCTNSICRQTVQDNNNSNTTNTAGLGLQQVERMLNIYYKQRHLWTYGLCPDGEHYQSFLKIEL